MTDFDNSQTKINLARAFAGECQDGARYQFLAKLAMDEGYAYLQSIFKTHAKNEMAHAQRFFNLLADNSSTKLKKNKLYKSPTAVKWKCSNCGFEHTSKSPWESCPSCELPQGYVEIHIDMTSGN